MPRDGMDRELRKFDDFTYFALQQFMLHVAPSGLHCEGYQMDLLSVAAGEWQVFAGGVYARFDPRVSASPTSGGSDSYEGPFPAWRLRSVLVYTVMHCLLLVWYPSVCE